MLLMPLARILWTRRTIILIALISSALGGFVVTVTSPPRYAASARVMLDLVKPDEQTGQILGKDFAEAYAGSQGELIRDYQVTGRVIDDLGWAQNADLQAQYAQRDPNDDRDFRRWASQIITAGASAQLVPDSNVLEITYRGGSPELAQAIADSLRRAYLDENLQTKRESARRDAAWFTGQADKLHTQLADLQTQFAGAQRAAGIVVKDESEDLDSLKLSRMSKEIDDPMMRRFTDEKTPVTGRLMQLNEQIAALGESLGPNNPKLQAMLHQRDALTSQIGDRRPSAADQAESAAKATAMTVENQRSLVTEQRPELAALHQMQVQVDVVRDRYVMAVQKIATLRQTADTASINLTAMGAVELPNKPEFPNKPLIAEGCVGLGLGFGGAVAVLAELLSRRIRNAQDLQTVLSAPVLATLPKASRPRPAGQRRWWSRFVWARRRREGGLAAETAG